MRVLVCCHHRGRLLTGCRRPGDQCLTRTLHSGHRKQGAAASAHQRPRYFLLPCNSFPHIRSHCILQFLHFHHQISCLTAMEHADVSLFLVVPTGERGPADEGAKPSGDVQGGGALRWGWTPRRGPRPEPAAATAAATSSPSRWRGRRGRRPDDSRHLAVQPRPLQADPPGAARRLPGRSAPLAVRTQAVCVRTGASKRNSVRVKLHLNGRANNQNVKLHAVLNNSTEQEPPVSCHWCASWRAANGAC